VGMIQIRRKVGNIMKWMLTMLLHGVKVVQHLLLIVNCYVRHITGLKVIDNSLVIFLILNLLADSKSKIYRSWISISESMVAGKMYFAIKHETVKLGAVAVVNVKYERRFNVDYLQDLYFIDGVAVKTNSTATRNTD
jgi:hypothetical protein